MEHMEVPVPVMIVADAGDREAGQRRPEAVSAACAGNALRRWVQA
jgi:hypothetical protein